MSDEAKQKYVPFWKPHPIDKDVLNKTKRYLVDTIDELDKLLNITYKDKKYMSFDIETTGLDPTADDAEIVGFSFSFDSTNGYYVPVAHAMGDNVGVEGIQLIYDKMCSLDKTFAANLQFDFVYMEFEGKRKGRDWDMSKVPYYDIFVGLYLADSNIKFPSLKGSAKFWLGWELDSFEQTLGDAYNFKYLDPKDAYTYGGFDSIMTFALAPISLRFYKEAKLSGKIDNEFIYPLAQMLKGTIDHDIPYLKWLEKDMQEKVDEYEKEIYKLVGTPFNIGSPKQLSDALLSIGFDTGIRTKTGYMKAGIDELEAQNKKTPNPIVQLLVDYKKLGKSLSTYVKPLLKEHEKNQSTRWRYAYHLYSAPTCRLSGGKDGKNDYYAAINMHCVKGDTILYTDKGIKQIKDIKIGDKVWDGEQFNKVTNWFNNGVQDVYRVKTQGGIYDITCTNKHKFYASGDFEPQFKPLKDLKVGDSVMINTKYVPSNNLLIDNTDFNGTDVSLGGTHSNSIQLNLNDKDLWFLMGYLSSGCLTRTYKNHKDEEYINSISLWVREYNEPIKDYLVSILDKFNINYRVSYEDNYKEALSRGRVKYSKGFIIKIYSTSFGKFVTKYLGFLNKKSSKKLPNVYYDLNTDCRLSFLSGSLVKAGGKNKKGTSWTIEFSNKDNASEYCIALKSFGIMSKVHDFQGRYKVTLCGAQQRNYDILNIPKELLNDVYVDKSKYCTLPKYLHDKSEFLYKFYPRYENPKSCVRYLDKNLGFDYNNMWTKIETIEYLGKEQVYDIEVENTHRYIANGILVHNSITKPKSKMWYVHDWKDGDERKEGDIVILDWRFSLVDKSDYQIEGFNPHYNLRSIFKPNENSYWVSIDFSAEELRLIANYAKLPMWTETFLNGGDLHENTAKAIWGEEAYNHDLRKRAKGANFGLSYGMSYYTAADNFGLSLEDAEDLVNGWWRVVPELKRYQAQTIRMAKKTGTVYNYFGRPRRVKHWLNSPIKKNVAFGERTCKNSPIQSAGADIMKLAMIKIYRKILTNPKYKGKVQFMSTIHDEVNLSINYEDRELFMEMFTDFYNCMYCKFKGWEVPFDVGLELGETWGNSFEFVWNEDKTKIVPNTIYIPLDTQEQADKVEVKEEAKTEEDELEFDLDF